MSRIEDKSKTPAQKANDARPPSDGPHKPGYKAKKDAASEAGPPYVVAVSKHEDDKDSVKSTARYTPEEVRAKAKSLLGSNKLTREERKVLQEILEADKTV